MGHLRKDHVIGSGAAALIGAAAGAALGSVVAGPAGAAVGAAAVGALGAVAGNRAAEAADPRDDLGRFQQIIQSMPYYISEMTWDDYAPAYRYGIEHYQREGQHVLLAVEPEMERGWEQARGGSRLLWSEAREAVAHVWRWYDEELHKTEHVPGAGSR